VRKLLEDTPFANLRLIAATRPNLASPQPSHALRVRFVRALRTLAADFVFIDLGAGADSTVMDYFMVCDDGVVVIAPEPTRSRTPTPSCARRSTAAASSRCSPQRCAR
jgi:MinD-like ATPase involved in chromosome partitioning or flagellar assembly